MFLRDGRRFYGHYRPLPVNGRTSPPNTLFTLPRPLHKGLPVQGEAQLLAHYILSPDSLFANLGDGYKKIDLLSEYDCYRDLAGTAFFLFNNTESFDPDDGALTGQLRESAARALFARLRAIFPAPDLTSHPITGTVTFWLYHGQLMRFEARATDHFIESDRKPNDGFVSLSAEFGPPQMSQFGDIYLEMPAEIRAQIPKPTKLK